MGIIYLKGNWIMMERRSEMVGEMRIVDCKDDYMLVDFDGIVIRIEKEEFDVVWGVIESFMVGIGVKIESREEWIDFGFRVIEVIGKKKMNERREVN